MPRLTQDDFDVAMALAEHAIRLTQPDLSKQLESMFADDREARVVERDYRTALDPRTPNPARERRTRQLRDDRGQFTTTEGAKHG